MKLTLILAGILAVNFVAVAQQPVVTAPAQTNQAPPATTLPAVVRPQPTTGTNQTSGGSVTNVPSSATTSTNVNSSTTSHPVTIIRGSDTSTTGNGSQPPPKENTDGVDPIKSTAGTPDDWRSGNAVPHVIPPRDTGANP